MRKYEIRKRLFPLDVDGRRWEWSVRLRSVGDVYSYLGDYGDHGVTRSRERALAKMHREEARLQALVHEWRALEMKREAAGIAEIHPI